MANKQTTNIAQLKRLTDWLRANLPFLTKEGSEWNGVDTIRLANIELEYQFTRFNFDTALEFMGIEWQKTTRTRDLAEIEAVALQRRTPAKKVKDEGTILTALAARISLLEAAKEKDANRIASLESHLSSVEDLRTKLQNSEALFKEKLNEHFNRVTEILQSELDRNLAKVNETFQAHHLLFKNQSEHWQTLCVPSGQFDVAIANLKREFDKRDAQRQAYQDAYVATITQLRTQLNHCEDLATSANSASRHGA